MNPAFSVIFFTTASGAGYGMLFWLGLMAAIGAVPASGWFGVPALAVALGLSTAGLLSSTFHLGHPERAWRALSQWRSSWLSREGVAAIVTFIPALVLAVAWMAGAVPGRAGTVTGLIAALLAMLTVVCTAMIYASLRTIRQWHQPLVLPVYLLCAAFSGAVCAAAFLSCYPAGDPRLPALLAVAFGFAVLAAKLAYWRRIDRPVVAPDATGLGRFGTVRPLDPPHTEENYLLKEMGFRVARRHAARLRRIALMVGCVLPILLMVLALAGLGAPALLAAVPCMLIGLFVERWLFFAEATHVVRLYYGR
ncbi:MAG: dimethyl sulfoxide reductase anchor subunit [Rhodospirillales bacterium]|nr:dimethyl sulfoxide reductase anchor subunit [Rhodospirillales bacterium]